MCSADGSIVSCHKAKIFRVLLRPSREGPPVNPVGGGSVVFSKSSKAKHFLKAAPKRTFVVTIERDTMA